MPKTPAALPLIALLGLSQLATPAVAPGAPAHAAEHRPRAEGVALTLSPPSGPVRIPFDLRGNHIYLRGRINDSDSLWIVFDTGASGNVIDAGVAKSLGLEVSSVVPSRGAGGHVDAGQIRNVTVHLPGVTLAGGSIAAIPLGAFERASGRAMEAIIGHPLLSRCVVRVDYAARVLEILPAESFDHGGRGTVVPLTFANNLPFVTASVTLPGRKPLKGRFVIDSGSVRALILSPKAIREQRVHEAITRTVEARGRGIGGQVPSRAGRVERFELAGFTFDRPVTMLPVPADAHIGGADILGNIGGDILRRFTVTYDYARKRMILEPNASFGDPFEADMSGLAPRMGPDGSEAIEVEWIQPESPASEAGVRPNDLIERIDGRPALEVGLPGLREMMRRPGETHRLLIRRGDERLEIAITTRRMI